MKNVLVDVDGILWDFSAELIKRLRNKYPEKDIPDNFTHWDHPIEYFKDMNEMLATFLEIHLSQEQFNPFNGAKELLNELWDNGYKIHIASNRHPESFDYLKGWLEKNLLLYDFIFCDHDKSVLWDEKHFEFIIDDSPKNQLFAMSKGSKVFTLRYEYNNHIPETCKFNNLLDMTNFLRYYAQSNT
jgi:hypothetical protein